VIKSKEEILQKLKISKLTEMQESAYAPIHKGKDTILIAPTGTGKTLAFLLPLIEKLDRSMQEVQLMVLAPSRELAIQIEQVAREMGTGHKIAVVYGGQKIAKDHINLHHTPSILVGTPGRIADHIRRESFDITSVKYLVLDEFDKSLEIGFEDEMEEIVYSLNDSIQYVLTSATDNKERPDFISLSKPITIDRSQEEIEALNIKKIVSPDKDKLATLHKALCHLGNQPGIVFCNYKESIQRVSEYLSEMKIKHGCFHGGLEQRDRERALIKFRNGTHNLILATDLAARGLDISDLKFIIHYHLPHREEEFTHRNGRTARMNADGTAYVVIWKDEIPKDFIGDLEEEILEEKDLPSTPIWSTLFISGGRKDKISKGDIAGLFIKEGDLSKEDLGLIELKPDCAFVAVKKNRADKLIKKLDNSRLKKKKVRIRLI